MEKRYPDSSFMLAKDKIKLLRFFTKKTDATTKWNTMNNTILVLFKCKHCQCIIDKQLCSCVVFKLWILHIIYISRILDIAYGYISAICNFQARKLRMQGNFMPQKKMLWFLSLCVAFNGFVLHNHNRKAHDVKDA